MPRRRNTTRVRQPVKRERLAGLTVTIQHCKRPPYQYSVVMRQDGKRLRERYLKTKEEAEGLAQQWSIDAGNTGALAATSISDADKRGLMEWREALEPFGKTPAEAVAFYVAHLKRCKVSVTIRELVQKLLTLKTKERKSQRYLADLRVRLAKFTGTFGDRVAAEIHPEEVSAWLHNLEGSPVTMNNYRRLVSVLFALGVKIGACERNVVEAVDPINEPEGEVGILTVPQARSLLEAARSLPEILPAIAIGLFAGVRDAELHRLAWTEINLESGMIEIKGSKAKSARRRLIPIRPVLLSWLKPLAQASGQIWPPGESGRRLHERARRMAGFGQPGTETAEEREAGMALTPWPSNALRHSFASYHLAHFKNSDELALELGHTNTALIFQHYRELVQPKEAAKFWALLPAGTFAMKKTGKKCSGM